ncbi:MAG TPA: hypothetical protein VME23_14155 [Terracidiphilus sp.]|nr:hypothetical protein [Terracidiphilus sp.]
MAGEMFYAADEIEQIAINLFYGWGYNFYKVENQLRADDQMVRSKAAWLLGEAATAVSAAESDYRREFLPAPTRAKPYPDADAVASAQKLERLHRAITGLEQFLHQLPAPANDRMTQRYRLEAPTLANLLHFDSLLVGQCELMRKSVTDADAQTVLKALPDLEAGIAAIRATLHDREAVLMN